MPVYMGMFVCVRARLVMCECACLLLPIILPATTVVIGARVGRCIDRIQLHLRGSGSSVVLLPSRDGRVRKSVLRIEQSNNQVRVIPKPQLGEAHFVHHA